MAPASVDLLVDVGTVQPAEDAGSSSRPRPQGDRLVPGSPLPWHTLPTPPTREGKRIVWRHRVYLGVYELSETFTWLQRAFAEDTEAYAERPGGLAACVGLVIDHDGRLVPDSAVMSSAIWGVGRIRNPGPSDPGWADGFDEACAAFQTAVALLESDRTPAGEGQLPAPHDSQSLAKLLRIAQARAGVTGLETIATQRVRIDSQMVSADRENDSPDFMNSSFLDDLSMMRSTARPGDIGAALTAYLTHDNSLNESRRIDVIAQPQAVDSGVAIDRMPLGRWPSNPEHALALSQQFAVNQALNDLAPTRGIMGVNGPPGTGKTTMLRDIVAGNVVERARRLARLEKPDDAFTATSFTWRAGNYPRTVPVLKPELTGFEMVVASANNAAVENVTIELPALTAIDERWASDADYFADIATAVLAAGSKDSPKAWGLVAARLGRKSNRSNFWSALWFDDEGPQKSKGSRSRRSDPTQPVQQRLQSRLKAWAREEAPVTSWGQARDNFNKAEREVRALIDVRQAALRRAVELRECERDAKTVASRVDAARHASKAADEAAAVQHEYATRLQQTYDIARDHEKTHLQARPGTLEILFSFGRAARSWRERLADLQGTTLSSSQRLNDALDLLHVTRRHAEESRAHLASAQSALVEHQARLYRLQTEHQDDRRRFPAWFAHPAQGDERELRAPWIDAELDAARSKLFLAALTLHRDFLANTPKTMLSGLRAVGDVVNGSYPKDLEPEKLRAAWRLLFLVVPLVSTTFASFGRMFGAIGPEAIGWLMIDEAGQAAPHLAARAIWHAQRVIAVGDPLQLEPVVTIPDKAKRDIAAALGVDETWIPPRASVQTLADRIARFGTTLSQGEEDAWVSAPLRVHRRCDDPMFSLCNQIAYDGIMVSGVHRKPYDPENPTPFDDHDGGAPSSRWLNEPTPTPGSNLQHKELTRLKAALNHLQTLGVPASRVIAISPFRAVADSLEALMPQYPGLSAGTIHTAQGREADVVFLVLGGDPAKPGAKAWAAKTVNLVNVAVSRAKRRLYVIGDQAAWSKHNYFRQLSATLDSAARDGEPSRSPFSIG